MTISPLAGKPAPKEMLIDLARLEGEYFERRPDLDDPDQRVSFGTSGHRGSSLRGSFTDGEHYRERAVLHADRCAGDNRT
jgi:phosphoglucomutase